MRLRTPAPQPFSDLFRGHRLRTALHSAAAWGPHNAQVGECWLYFRGLAPEQICRGARRAASRHVLVLQVA